jgi:uncharacterized protein (DUF58 family)
LADYTIIRWPDCGFSAIKQPIQNTHERIKYDMKNNLWFKLGGAALLGLMILGFAVPSGQTATTVTLTALVQDQQCQGGDFVNVTLTATLNPPAPNVRFQWDFNNDGIFDTALSSSPTVSHLYPDEVNVTAVVKAVKGRRSATDSVTFSTLRCEN